MRHAKLFVFSLVALAAVAPLTAQRGDPTMAVTGTGKLPDGWMLRFDPSRGNAPTPPMTAVSLETMAGGLHVKSGPAAIYYNTKDMGSGQYFIGQKPGRAHPQAYDAEARARLKKLSEELTGLVPSTH